MRARITCQVAIGTLRQWVSLRALVAVGKGTTLATPHQQHFRPLLLPNNERLSRTPRPPCRPVY